MEMELSTELDKSQLHANSNEKRTKRGELNAHKTKPALQLSSTPGENGAHARGHEWHGENFYKRQGFGRARVQGAFVCDYKGDLFDIPSPPGGGETYP